MWLKERNSGALSLIVFGMLGCTPERATTDAGQETVVAEIGARRLTLTELEAELRSQPDFMRARLDSRQRKREYVESLIRNELLLQEARRRGLQDQPEVKVAIERLLIQQLLKEATRDSEPSEADAQAWYDAHLAELSRPARVQVALVEFGARGGLTAPVRAEVEKEVLKLRALKEPQRHAAFSALVLARSTHEGSRALEGDVGLRTEEELTHLFGVEAAKAAVALASPGDVSAPVNTPRGFVIFRLVVKQPAETRSFAAEKSRILARLAAETRARQLDTLTKSLQESAKVTIHDEALDLLGGPPGAMPLVP